MFAVISHKGNQYKVEPNREYKIDLVDPGQEKGKINFSEVLLISDEKKSQIGTPFIDGAVVEAEFVKNDRLEKTEVFKFHSKKRYKKTLGHRQPCSIIKIINIKLKNEK